MPTTTGLATSFITFSRPSASGGGATVTDRDGKIKWAGHNLLSNSESFDASAWAKVAATVTANSTVAPNGATTADTFKEDNTFSQHQITQSLTVPVGVITFRVFAKLGSGSRYLQMRSSGLGTGVAYANYDLSTGVVVPSGSGGTALVSTSVTPSANGFYLCEMVANFTSAPSGMMFQLSNGTGENTSYTGDNTSSIVLWGAHLYRSDLAGMQHNPAMPAGMGSYYPTTPRNLVGNSENFNSWATKSGLAATPVIVNTIAAPNGLQTADKIVENSSASTHYVAQTTASLTASPYVASVYAKAAERSFVSLGFDGLNAWFNLSTGTVGTVESGLTATITAAGDGWYRCAVYRTVAVAAAKTFAVYIANANNAVSYTGDGTSGIYLWGAQLSDSASLDAYSPVYGAAVTSAAYYAPRLDYDPVTLAAKGLLVEEARTNIMLRSNEFDNASWTPLQSTVSANAIASPDGTANADKIAEDTATGSHGVYQSVSLSANITYTFSVYAKAHERTKINLFNNASSATAANLMDVTFDLSAGTATATQGTATITNVGGGWYRCAVTNTMGATGASSNFQLRMDNGSGTSYAGSTGSGLYLYGSQVEVGSFPTSLIPTGSATATRGADVASVSTQAFPYSASASSLVISYTLFSDGGENILELSASASANGLLFATTSGTNNVTAYVDASSVSLGATVLNAVTKIGIAYDGASNGTVRNGGAVSSVGITVSAAANKLCFGSSFGGLYQMSGHIRQITYLPRRISNAELQSRTL